MEKRENSLIQETKRTHRSFFSWLSIAYEEASLDLFKNSQIWQLWMGDVAPLERRHPSKAAKLGLNLKHFFLY